MREARQLIVTAMGWGGLPSHEAACENHRSQLPIGDYSISVADVPVDGFWSNSTGNADGHLEENPFLSYRMSSVTAVPEDDGSKTLSFGPEPNGGDNFLYVMGGWSYGVRFYQPRAAIRGGAWRFPKPERLM